MMRGMCAEELHRLAHRQVEHVGDGLAVKTHLERLAVEALAVATRARRVGVGHELHVELDLRRRPGSARSGRRAH